MAVSRPLPVIQGGGNDSASISIIPDELTPYRDAALASLSQTDAVAPPVPLVTDNQLFAFADSTLPDPFALTPYIPQSGSSPTGLSADVANTQSGNGGGVTSLVSSSASSAASPALPSASMSPPPVVPPPTMPPVANPDSFTVGQGTFTVGASGGVLSNDTNPTGQPMSAVLVTTTTHGALSLNANGSLVYTPTAGYTGLDSFSYKVTAGGLTSNTATDTFYVSNTGTPPTLTNPGNQTRAEGQAVNLAAQATGMGLQFAAVNLPTGLNINSANGTIFGTVDYAAAENFGGTYATTVIVANTYGSATQQFNWTITNTARPPVLVNPGMQVSSTGVPISLQLAGFSPDGDKLAYTAVGLPSGLAVDGPTGLITGLIAYSANVSNSVTVTATDTVTNAATSQTFAWSVMPMSHAPTLDPIDAQTNAAGDVVLLWVNATDVDGNPLTFTATGLPTGLGINSTTGDITGTVANSAYRTTPYAVTVTASDGTLSASQSFAWSVTAVQVANPGEQSGTIGQAVSLPISALNLSGGALSYSATGLPTGLSINATTGLISGTITAGAWWQDSYLPTVSATNGTDTASKDFHWAVAPATGTAAPALTAPSSQGGTAGGSVSLQIVASSPAGSLTYSIDTLPDGLTVDQATGIISGTLTSLAVGTTSTTVTVFSPTGGTASSTFSWVVVPASVAVTVTPVTTVAGHDTGPVTVATFTTPNLVAGSGEYAATITWGDGSTSQGIVAGQNGAFTVSGDHTYSAAGGYALAVTVIRFDGGTVAATGTATVSTATPINPAGRTVAIQGSNVLEDTSGVVANQLVAVFEDSNLADSASALMATVDWADGTTSAAVVSGVNGLFQIFAGHTYAVAGSQVAHVLIGLVASQLSGLAQTQFVVQENTLPAPPIEAPKYTPYTVKNLVDDFNAAKAKDPNYTSPFLARIKSIYGFDLPGDMPAKVNPGWSSFLDVRKGAGKQAGLILADFLTMTRFSSKIDPAKGSIIQVVNLQVSEVNAVGMTVLRKGPGDKLDYVEGFVVGKNGVAVGPDYHQTMIPLVLDPTTTKSVTVTTTFTLGAGTYKKDLITGNRSGKLGGPGIFDIFPGGKDTDVQWASQKNPYTVTFTFYADGKWKLDDPSSGQKNVTGQWAKPDPPKK